MSNEELIITNELEEQTLQETQESKQNKESKKARRTACLFMCYFKTLNPVRK